MLKLFVMVAALGLASAAWADNPPPAAGQATASQATLNPAARRCVTDTSTGSRVPRRVCRTNAEWAAIAEQARSEHDTTPDTRGECHADRQVCAGIGTTAPPS